MEFVTTLAAGLSEAATAALCQSVNLAVVNNAQLPVYQTPARNVLYARVWGAGQVGQRTDITVSMESGQAWVAGAIMYAWYVKDGDYFLGVGDPPEGAALSHFCTTCP